MQTRTIFNHSTFATARIHLAADKHFFHLSLELVPAEFLSDLGYSRYCLFLHSQVGPSDIDNIMTYGLVVTE